jgi:hypothetical protein
MRRVKGRILVRSGLLGATGAAVLLLLSLGSGSRLAAQQPPPEPEPPPPPVLLIFGPGVGAFQRGWVTLTRMPRGRQTIVTIELAPEVEVEQHAAIVQGHCRDMGPNLGPVANALTNVVNGESITTLDVGRRLLFTGDFAIVVQGTSTNPDTFVACADIPRRHDLEGGGPGPRPPR